MPSCISLAHISGYCEHTLVRETVEAVPQLATQAPSAEQPAQKKRKLTGAQLARAFAGVAVDD